MRFSKPTVMVSLLAMIAGTAQGESLVTTSKNMYGTPGGLIDMPTAEMAPDGDLSVTVSHFGGTTRNSLTFQITPRLTGTFRYASLRDYQPPTYTHRSYYDRSFDLKYQLLTEGTYRPGVAIGLRDFIGTGLYGGEYVVATKTIGKRLRVSAGVGWGRLGSVEGIRPTGNIGQGGDLTIDDWFKGPKAIFGGISYAATDRLTFKAEYSSDAYNEETGGGQDPTASLFQRKSDFNFGVDYKVSDTINIGAYYLYGSEIGINVSLALDPKGAAIPGGGETAPLPVRVRPKHNARDLGWAVADSAKAKASQNLATSLAREGLYLEGIQLSGTRARVLIRNARYDIESQAVGRTARAMSRSLPDSVETFEITQTYKGIPTGSVTLSRSDLEALENAPATAIQQKAVFSSGQAGFRDVPTLDGTYPRLTWGLSPYLKLNTFDPDNPVRADLGIKLAGDYSLGPGWQLSGSVSVKLAGNVDAASTGRTGAIATNPPPVVRSDARQYSTGNDPRLDYLTIAKYGRLGENIYTRVTAGYLETMYAGVSGEVLWKPVNSRLALGAEVNFVRPRDYDGGFGLRSRNTTYVNPITGATTPAGAIPELNGHVSAYYDIGNGFHGQLDVGRYLAGDWGATLSLDREFANGWTVGAWVTKTDLSASSFGEGSYDKGLRIIVPIGAVIGTPNRRKNEIALSSLTRDGGARLRVNGRLYDAVRDTHKPEMAKSWGRFWR
ncbi:MAG: hypothetical protein CSA70_09690 [Rhodobacterales bacterium]|nr:MAG: hypothetical protein CSA70_09690 [Rhodobacterales bacterium]